MSHGHCLRYFGIQVETYILGKEIENVSYTDFAGCTQLASIVVEEGNKNYDSRNNCNAIIESKTNELVVGCKGTTIPNTISSIGNNAFEGCIGLINMNIPNTVTSIKYKAFHGCTAMTNVNIGNSVRLIGGSVFRECTSLTSITLPNSLKTLGGSAFMDCTKLKTVTLPNSVANKDDFIFDGCTALTDIYINIVDFANKNIWNDVTSRKHYLFDGKEITGSYSIPDNVTAIGQNALYDCTELTSVTIPMSVLTVDSCAFCGCSGLSTVIITSPEISIAEDAFANCSSLPVIDNIKYAGTYLVEAIDKTLSTYNINEDTRFIGSSAFSGCIQLSSITIPSSVVSICEKAFFGCKDLKEIAIGDSVKTIRNRAFYGCTAMTDVRIGNSVRFIGGSAFRGCSSLTSVTLPNSLKTLGGSAFMDCAKLRSVTLPNSITNKDDYIFDGCTALTDIYINIGDFANNNLWSDIDINKHYLYAGKEITGHYIIPDFVTQIGNYAFYGGISLTSVTIPKSVTSIGNGAFNGCNNMTYVAFMQDENVNATQFVGITELSDKTQIIVPYNCLNVWKQEFSGQNFVSLCHGIRATKNSATLNINNTLPELLSNAILTASIDGKEYERTGDSIVITGLRPNTTYTIALSVVQEENVIQDSIEITTDKGLTLAAAVQSVTQTTATIATTRETYGEEILSETIDGKTIRDGTVTLTGLIPGTTYTKTYVVTTRSGEKDSVDVTFTTKDIVVNIEGTSSATSVSLVGSFDAGDAGVSESGFEDYSDVGELFVSGLEPETEYSFTFYVKSRNGEKMFQQTITISTQQVELKMLTPRVVSSGNVVVAAESNISDEESNVGFEWRREDWKDDIGSKHGTAFLYQGTIEGYIHDLYIHRLWKVRPYYCSGSDNYYYGNWVNFDPSDVSYFEPTVHTYAYVEMEGNSAHVKGYILNGSDKVKEQGFKYWKKTGKASSPLYPQATEVPDDAMTVNVDIETQSLDATLPNLQENIEYSYVAFATTDKGTTYYGEEQSFTVDNPDGIVSLYTDDFLSRIVKVYTLSGKLVYTGLEQELNLDKGLYILRYPNGKSKKVVY